MRCWNERIAHAPVRHDQESTLRNPLMRHDVTPASHHASRPGVLHVKFIKPNSSRHFLSAVAELQQLQLLLPLTTTPQNSVSKATQSGSGKVQSLLFNRPSCLQWCVSAARSPVCVTFRLKNLGCFETANPTSTMMCAATAAPLLLSACLSRQPSSSTCGSASLFDFDKLVSMIWIERSRDGCGTWKFLPLLNCLRGPINAQLSAGCKPALRCHPVSTKISVGAHKI